jgi:hypothetical protein
VSGSNGKGPIAGKSRPEDERQAWKGPARLVRQAACRKAPGQAGGESGGAEARLGAPRAAKHGNACGART